MIIKVTLFQNGVVNQDGNEYPGYYFIMMNSAGNIEIEITDGYSGAGDYTLITAGTPINDGDWHRVTFTANRDAYGKIYIDGQLQNTVDISSHPGSLDNDEPLTIGASGWGTKYLDGAVDNVVLWDYVLSDYEIKSKPLPSGDEFGLLGAWNFNEVDEVVYDLSDNSNNGQRFSGSYIENIDGCMDGYACNYMLMLTLMMVVVISTCYDNGDHSFYYSQNDFRSWANFSNPIHQTNELSIAFKFLPTNNSLLKDRYCYYL